MTVDSVCIYIGSIQAIVKRHAVCTARVIADFRLRMPGLLDISIVLCDDVWGKGLAAIDAIVLADGKSFFGTNSETMSYIF